ncbi:MAG: hypothetical protein JWQ10_3898 [Herbaspirillum sp.]|nr:hypothetical protein [Herbaspirillum sp.]
MDVKKSYKEMAIRVLGNFQLLELCLKIYVGKSYEFIRHQNGRFVIFDYSIGDIENFPLEKLLFIFKKMNRNRSLQKRLNVLKDQRNFLAHNALLILMDGLGDKDEIHTWHSDLYHLEDELMSCLKTLSDEGGLLISRFSGQVGRDGQEIEFPEVGDWMLQKNIPVPLSKEKKSAEPIRKKKPGSRSPKVKTEK